MGLTLNITCNASKFDKDTGEKKISDVFGEVLNSSYQVNVDIDKSNISNNDVTVISQNSVYDPFTSAKQTKRGDIYEFCLKKLPLVKVEVNDVALPEGINNKDQLDLFLSEIEKRTVRNITIHYYEFYGCIQADSLNMLCNNCLRHVCKLYKLHSRYASDNVNSHAVCFECYGNILRSHPIKCPFEVLKGERIAKCTDEVINDGKFAKFNIVSKKFDFSKGLNY